MKSLLYIRLNYFKCQERVFRHALHFELMPLRIAKICSFFVWAAYERCCQMKRGKKFSTLSQSSRTLQFSSHYVKVFLIWIRGFLRLSLSSSLQNCINSTLAPLTGNTCLNEERTKTTNIQNCLNQEKKRRGKLQRKRNTKIYTLFFSSALFWT